MGVSIKDLKGKVKRPVRVAKVCLDGDLWAKHDELSAQLDALSGQKAATLAGDPNLRRVAEELAEVEDEMRASEVKLEFRGISAFQLKEIQRRFPLKDNQDGWDVDASFPALIAATAVEPTTEEEAAEFLEELNKAASEKIFTVVWSAINGSTEVPTNARAFALISGSGSK